MKKVFHADEISKNESDRTPHKWNMLSEEEQAKQKLFLKVSLYNDLELSLQDIFKDT